MTPTTQLSVFYLRLEDKDVGEVIAVKELGNPLTSVRINLYDNPIQGHLTLPILRKHVSKLLDSLLEGSWILVPGQACGGDGR